MELRLLSFLRGVPSHRDEHSAQYAYLAFALDSARRHLNTACDEFTPDADTASSPKIKLALLNVHAALSRRADRAHPGRTFSPKPGTLAAQIGDMEIIPVYRRLIYDIALVTAEDMRADVLRLLRDFGQGGVEDKDLRPRIARLLALSVTPIDLSDFPEIPQDKDKSSGQRKRA